ncbi:hypothetical protein PVK06_040538 [Gossypium arboreum]|uniref:Uncharacterized protein n=1 Tax=Gossypium arboreum TaxID=29729 RepID=A0ABR0N601_GOSAR|nr:hypothetical protein PVK06_040538 [Gossypium arboreum]
MAVKNSTSAHAKRSKKKAAASSSLIPKFMKIPKTTMALALLIIDSLLVSFIIAYVPYFVWDFIHHKPGHCLINLCKDRCASVVGSYPTLSFKASSLKEKSMNFEVVFGGFEI